MLVAPITLYLATALLFPNEQEGEPITSWREHYFEHNRGFFLFLGSTYAIDLVDTVLKGWAHLQQLGPLYYGSMMMFIVLCSIAAFTKSPRYHGAFAVFYLIYNSAMLSSNLLRLM
jgi:hypothetical protein